MAAEQLLNMTHPDRLEEFRNRIMAASSSAAAQRATQAVALQLGLRSLDDNTARATREQRLQVRRLQGSRLHHMHQAQLSHQPLSLRQPLARESEEVWVSAKECGACGLHKSKETGHTNTTCPTHCRECRTQRQDPEQRTGCSCQM